MPGYQLTKAPCNCRERQRTLLRNLRGHLYTHSLQTEPHRRADSEGHLWIAATRAALSGQSSLRKVSKALFSSPAATRAALSSTSSSPTYTRLITPQLQSPEWGIPPSPKPQPNYPLLPIPEPQAPSFQKHKTKTSMTQQLYHFKYFI
jgi:hypothetical protein